jgi:hypothetical protein
MNLYANELYQMGSISKHKKTKDKASTKEL